MYVITTSSHTCTFTWLCKVKTETKTFDKNEILNLNEEGSKDLLYNNPQTPVQTRLRNYFKETPFIGTLWRGVCSAHPAMFSYNGIRNTRGTTMQTGLFVQHCLTPSQRGDIVFLSSLCCVSSTEIYGIDRVHWL